jgi:hypothetical protein
MTNIPERPTRLLPGAATRPETADLDRQEVADTEPAFAGGAW